MCMAFSSLWLHGSSIKARIHGELTWIKGARSRAGRMRMHQTSILAMERNTDHEDPACGGRFEKLARCGGEPGKARELVQRPAQGAPPVRAPGGAESGVAGPFE